MVPTAQQKTATNLNSFHTNAPTAHSHSVNCITNPPSLLPNPLLLTIIHIHVQIYLPTQINEQQRVLSVLAWSPSNAAPTQTSQSTPTFQPDVHRPPNQPQDKHTTTSARSRNVERKSWCRYCVKGARGLFVFDIDWRRIIYVCLLLLLLLKEVGGRLRVEGRNRHRSR